MTETGDQPFTREEFIELFGEMMPMEALNLVFRSPDTMTTGEVRQKLRAMAARIQENLHAAAPDMQKALTVIADIAEGSGSVNGLPHIARIARAALSRARGELPQTQKGGEANKPVQARSR